MSLLSVNSDLPQHHLAMFEAGVKLANDAAPAYNLAGMLYVSYSKGKPWLLLSVPNAMLHGIFQAMDEPGIEEPVDSDNQRVNAHITVMRPEELDSLGGPDAITERGKRFNYTVGRLISFEPTGWANVSRVWALRVHSPELQLLRRTYGLSSLPSEGKFDFHITCAIRRRGVTARSETAKESQ
jgi:hypothetical protein